jgi:hypothetical protein
MDNAAQSIRKTSTFASCYSFQASSHDFEGRGCTVMAGEYHLPDVQHGEHHHLPGKFSSSRRCLVLQATGQQARRVRNTCASVAGRLADYLLVLLLFSRAPQRNGLKLPRPTLSRSLAVAVSPRRVWASLLSITTAQFPSTPCLAALRTCWRIWVCGRRFVGCLKTPGCSRVGLMRYDEPLYNESPFKSSRNTYSRLRIRLFESESRLSLGRGSSKFQERVYRGEACPQSMQQEWYQMVRRKIQQGIYDIR